MVTAIAQIHCEPSQDATADLQLMTELEILKSKSLHWSGQISAPAGIGGISISYWENVDRACGGGFWVR